MMFYKIFAILLICIFISPGLLFAKEENTKSIELLMECTVDTYIPKKGDDAKFTCSIINNREEEINVNITISPEIFVIYGKGEQHNWPSYLWRYEEGKDLEEEIIAVEPGEKVLIFEEFLDVLFFDCEKLDKEEEVEAIWIWDWIAHPMPPKSPIHIFRGEEYEERAAFWFSLNIGDEVLESNKVVLEIKE